MGLTGRGWQTVGVPEFDERWSILDGAPDATIVADATGAIAYANQRVHGMLGWAPAELVGRHIETLIPTELRQRHAADHAAYQASPKSRMMGVGLELEAVCRDGSRIPVEIALNPIPDGDTHLVMASIRDISDRVRLATQLNETGTRLAVVDDRDRIARDLHDRVIQRLFASGLHLQAALGRPDQSERVAAVIDEIDEAIKEIRTTIFTMHSPRGLHAGCESAIRLTVTEASRLLGHQPRLSIHGLCALVPDDLAEEAVDVIRELLTNVAKHAKASTSGVTVEVSDHTLSIVVFDDGVGIVTDNASSGQGVRNIDERATRRGGMATFVALEAGGTLVTWTVPLG